LKVTYQSTLRAFSEYLCLEHEIPGVRYKAGKLWSELGGKFPAPASVREALDRTNELRPPHTIRVWLNKEWPEITAKEFPVDRL